MKKHLLSLLIVGLTFIGFLNSEYVVVNTLSASSMENGSCDYSYINTSDGDYYLKIINTPNTDVDGTIRLNYKGYTTISSLSSYDSPLPQNSSAFLDVKYYINFPLNECPVFQLLKYQESSSGGSDDNGGSDDGLNLVSGDDLSSVVSGLFSVVWEFIPYIVYISIGLLLSTLGFYAIKWLCNWFYNKFLSIFKK